MFDFRPKQQAKIYEEKQNGNMVSERVQGAGTEREREESRWYNSNPALVVSTRERMRKKSRE